MIDFGMEIEDIFDMFRQTGSKGRPRSDRNGIEHDLEDAVFGGEEKIPSVWKSSTCEGQSAAHTENDVRPAVEQVRLKVRVHLGRFETVRTCGKCSGRAVIEKPCKQCNGRVRQCHTVSLKIRLGGYWLQAENVG